MPRRPKSKRKFRGNQFADSIHELRNVNSVNNVEKGTCTPNTSNPISVLPRISPASASRRKLVDTDVNNGVDIDVNSVVNNSVNSESGNIIVNVNLLSAFIQSAVKCKKCDSSDSVQVVEDISRRSGLASNINIVCSNCNFTQSCMTSQVNRQRLYEVNVRYTYGLRAIGRGKRSGQMFAAMMDLPPPPNRQFHYTKVIGRHVKEVSEASMRTAVKEAVAENPVVDQPGRQNTDIPVALDGSWHKRGHTSLNGVVTATAVDGGKVVDLECMTKYCSCKKDRKGLKVHEKNCSANYEGTSGGMEVEGAVRIFNRSIARHNVRYTDYLGDGDSKGFKKVVESKPYGDNVIIEKLECVGHVQKRMGSRLLKLVQEYKGKTLSDGKRIGGKGRLSKEEIDKIQNYYGNAIRRNANDLPAMKRDVWAIYFHKLSTDEEPQHSLCPQGEDSWCLYNRSLVTGKPYTHKHSLPKPVMMAIKHIFRDLAHEDLLKKCLHGKTQNCNESFNNVIWTRVPKTVFVGYYALQLGAYDAALCFNNGNTGRIDVFQCMGMKPGNNTCIGLRALDNLRVAESDIAAEAATKQARQAKRGLKRRREDVENAEDPDDPNYGAGMH